MNEREGAVRRRCVKPENSEGTPACYLSKASRRTAARSRLPRTKSYLAGLVRTQVEMRTSHLPGAPCVYKLYHSY